MTFQKSANIIIILLLRFVLRVPSVNFVNFELASDGYHGRSCDRAINERVCVCVCVRRRSRSKSAGAWTTVYYHHRRVGARNGRRKPSKLLSYGYHYIIFRGRFRRCRPTAVVVARHENYGGGGRNEVDVNLISN